GTSWGHGVDATGRQVPGADFNIPDLRGLFLRGIDERAPSQGGRDADGPRPLASVENDMLHDHTHFLSLSHFNNADATALQGVGAHSPRPNDFVTSGVRESGIAGGETRPRNAGVYYLIRN